MSDEAEELTCVFCNEQKELGMQVLPNGQPVLICGSCAAAMATAAETAQKQFDIINEAAAETVRQSRILLTFGVFFLAPGASILWFNGSVAAMSMVVGACLFIWGLIEVLKR